MESSLQATGDRDRSRADLRLLRRRLAPFRRRLLSRRGDRLVVAAELTDADEVSQLWGDRFDTSIDHILAVEANISARIGNALQVELSGDASAWSVKRYTDSPVAHLAFHAVNNHVIGYTLQEQAMAYVVPPDGDADALARSFLEGISADDHPHTVTHVQQHLDGDTASSFELVLDLILDGLTRLE